MDRALKERIIGATVLVVFAVLVVPVFLDGPSTDSEISSESVTLPGQSEQRTRQQTIVLNRDRTEPVPQAAGAEQMAPPPATTSSKAASVRSRPTEAIKTAVSKPPTPKPAATKSQASKPPSQSVTGMWAVQMGSFANKSNAERLAVDLREKGFAAFLSQLKTSSGQLHRVRIGPQKDRSSAESVSAQLNRAGHQGQVVPHP